MGKIRIFPASWFDFFVGYMVVIFFLLQPADKWGMYFIGVNKSMCTNLKGVNLSWVYERGCFVCWCVLLVDDMLVEGCV